MFFSPCSTLLTDTFLNIPEGNEGCEFVVYHIDVFHYL